MTNKMKGSLNDYTDVNHRMWLIKMQTVFDCRINGHPGNYVRVAGWRLEEVRTISQRLAIPKEMSSERDISRNVDL